VKTCDLRKVVGQKNCLTPENFTKKFSGKGSLQKFPNNFENVGTDPEQIFVSPLNTSSKNKIAKKVNEIKKIMYTFQNHQISRKHCQTFFSTQPNCLRHFFWQFSSSSLGSGGFLQSFSSAFHCRFPLPPKGCCRGRGTCFVFSSCSFQFFYFLGDLCPQL
jgi:hypothetical protein